MSLLCKQFLSKILSLIRPRSLCGNVMRIYLVVIYRNYTSNGDPEESNVNCSH